MNNLKFMILSLLVAFVAVSCSDDDSDFAGKDNYITSFALVQGEDVYQGEITGGNAITVDVPQNISLDGLVPDYKISENATISPDPATISDWSKSVTFTVTAYNNNDKRTYTYSLTRSTIVEKNSVVLSTQAEIDAFAARQVSAIDGTLTIGKSVALSDEDSIRSLAALSSLKSVTGNIIVNSNYAKKELNEFKALQKLGGTLIINSALIEDVEFPIVATIGGDIEYKTPTNLISINFPELTNLGGRLLLNVNASLGANTNNVIYTDLLFPKLATAKEIVLGRNKTLTEIRFPELKTIESIKIEGSQYYPTEEIEAGTYTKKISFDKLETIYKDFALGNCYYLQELNLPQLKTVGGKFEIANTNVPAADEIDAKQLTNIGGDFTLKSVTADDFSGFKSLAGVGGSISRTFGQWPITYFNGTEGLEALSSVGGTISLSGNYTNLNGLKSLRTVGAKITLSSNSLSDVAGIKDLKAIDELFLSTSGSSLSLSALKNVDITTLNMNLTPSVAANYDIKGVAAENIIIRGNINGSIGATLVGDQTLKANLTLDGIVVLSGTKKIEGNLNCGKKTTTSFYPRKYEFTDLEEVSDTLFVRLDNNTIGDVQYPKLKKAAQVVYYYPAMTTAIVAANMPLLETVTHDFRFEGNVKGFNFSALKTVGGLFQLIKYGTGANQIADLSGFPQLQSAGSVEIGKFGSLVSYEALKSVVGKLTGKSQWSVYNNGYNPTYEEVKAGKLTQE